ncbi:FMN-binding protein [Streptomyces sp. NBC_00038]|uniref:FMN-binding protein n=1 Tax=Streptomyces sp. NBC_00038 TaxID=2903615 RepID=UPI00225AB916|nr:FMN-binding protein [Streptomyces sp. NBC_00038]MCX5561735.1 FMN-binding protein [Streptomyces sp. NBC_00038]
MKRVLPVVALSALGLITVWRYEPTADTSSAATTVTEPASTPSASSGSSGTSTQVVAGSTVATEKGDVQVEVTFDGDTIASVRMLTQPNHPQTTAAVPKLIQETLEAQSADIDTVSGATITSDGYRESLQAAIDAKPETSTASPSASASSEAASETVAGSTVATEKGDVQVEVTFEGDTIASVRMLTQPNHPQTTAAVPKLIQETLDAQSADIDNVSGATITSDGYKESLQAAIDAKGA